MELINATRMVAGYNMGLEPSGRELLVVVIKGTFVLPKPGEQVRLADEQLPLIMADTFTGEPGFSAPVHEIDFAPRKRACDILLNGSAYAPEGRPTQRVPVGVRAGGMTKRFTVVGDRRWHSGVGGFGAGSPEPFVVKTISYDVAFGGTDAQPGDESSDSAYRANPVGRGYGRRRASVEGRPLPNTEETSRPVLQPKEAYLPMAFGPVGRGWEPRCRFAGTYDKHWLEDHFPFLPPDFDDLYYQTAPADQRISSLTGPLEIALMNLTPDGRRSFVLPDFEAPVHVFLRNGQREDRMAVLDTVLIEPDHERVALTWRLTRPLRKSLFEVAQVLVGRKSPAWWRARQTGKAYLPSLSGAGAAPSTSVAGG